ncbi:MAG: HlyC/CorC family transporter [Gammaproteobacteria bacterium]|nr:HlyC/CorC family transporter [Gammaproteobacteria bacterium]
MLTFIAAVSVVLVTSFLCSIFESVLLSITRPQIELLNRKGKRAGELLAQFKDNMDVPIAAILILNTAAHTIGAAVAGASYIAVFDPATLWLFSLLFTLAVLLFTEIIPKTLGVSYAVALSGPVARGIQVLTVVLKPLVVVSERLSRSLRRSDAMPITSAEEIRLLAALGRSAGDVGERTADMVVGATQLRRLEAHDIMLPRDKVHFLSADMDRDAVMAAIRETGHSRFPFTTTGDVNDASRVVLVKKLFDWLLQHPDGPIDWNSVTIEILIVPESMTLPRLLRTFQDNRKHLALVVDEYGGVEGIATLEDVLEEIVGDIDDESDQPTEDIHPQSDGSVRVKADVDLRKLSAELGITWEPVSEATTVGGLVSETLERIPVPGDAVDWHGYRIEVLRADRRKPRLLWVYPEPDDDTATD